MKIRELRLKKELTMKQLGEILSVAESTISLYERGKRQPDFETLKRIADFFDVSIDYLLSDENQTPASQESIPKAALPGETAEFSEARRKLLKLFETIPEDQLEKAYQIVALSCDLDAKNKTKEEE